jgi:hypothetical protein
MNTCAGGSARSKHLENRAIDFDLPKRGDNVERLCAFWREHGQALNMGLGFYTATAIHVDTAGYRTWGGDYTWRTSLCTPPQPPIPAPAPDPKARRGTAGQNVSRTAA